MAFASFILYAILLLQISFGANAHEMIKETLENNHNNVVNPKVDQDGHRGLDPALSVFFRVTDLYRGKKMPIYFASNDDSTPTHLLSREEADSIFISSSELPNVLKFFSFSTLSQQAKAIETTLKQCEYKPKGGNEFKFCATSLESMLDTTRDVLGTEKPKVMSTNILSSNHTQFQEYTFAEKPLEIKVPKMVACHSMAYPYKVYYCHGHKSRSNRLFKIPLDGKNGERVKGLAVCHMDTSNWDRDHVVFRVLGGQPGSSPVCHFLPADNLVLISSR